MLTAVQISADERGGRADRMLAETGDVKNPVVTEMWKDGKPEAIGAADQFRMPRKN
jgi:hypothetical protein